MKAKRRLSLLRVLVDLAETDEVGSLLLRRANWTIASLSTDELEDSIRSNSLQRPSEASGHLVPN